MLSEDGVYSGDLRLCDPGQEQVLRRSQANLRPVFLHDATKGGLQLPVCRVLDPSGLDIESQEPPPVCLAVPAE